MCWKPEYLVLILLSTVIDYFAGLMMGKKSERSSRRKYLILSLVLNFGVLFIFKYYTFFSSTAELLFSTMRIPIELPRLDVLLPVGISFYTFQTLSYTIDVYKGEKSVEKNFAKFALYVSFFPQLVAGPIERSTHLLPQFDRIVTFDIYRIIDGLKLIIRGLFKKIVIADRLALFVDHIYGNPESFGGGSLLLATYFFAFQIYCDFSGYTDIARGSAKILGFDLMENFRMPYFSSSIKEFWSKWHISLSGWFKDYLYIPLGGNRKGPWRNLINLLVVFVLSGLWHGANMTFVFWGFIHGVFLIVGKWLQPYKVQLLNSLRSKQSVYFVKLVSIGIPFHLVLLSWIFFRARTLREGIMILTKITDLNFSLQLDDMQMFSFILGIILIVCLIIIESFQSFKISISDKVKNKMVALEYYVYLLFIVFFSVMDRSEFIYFQF